MWEFWDYAKKVKNTHTHTFITNTNMTLKSGKLTRKRLLLKNGEMKLTQTYTHTHTKWDEKNLKK